MAVASLFFGLGAWTRSFHSDLAGVEYPLPSLADLFFVPGYWLFARAVLLFVRNRAREASFDSWIDALIPASAGTVLIWVSVFGPYVTESGRSVEERVLHGGYFFLTLMLMTVTLRLVVAPGVRVTSYRLLTAAVALFLASDVLGTAAIANGWDTKLFTLSALPTATLFCVAVLHPSSRHFVDVPIDTEAQLGATRLVTFGVALLIPPAVTLYEFEAAGVRRPADLVFIIVSSIVMVGLVLLRMHRLVRARERIAARERALRRASESLVAAGSISALSRQSAEALSAVIDSAPVRCAGVAQSLDDGAYEVVNVDIGIEVIQPGERITFDEDDQQHVGELLWAAHRKHRGLELYGAQFSVPEEVDRVLFAFTGGPIDRHDRRAFESLGREVGLARRGLLAAQMIERSRTERRFESLVQHSSDIVIVTDNKLIATYISPALERQLGWKASDLLGTRITEIVPEVERESVLRNLAKLIDSNPSAAQVELAVNDASGRRRLIDLTVTDLTQHPDVAGYVLNGRDVTEATQLRADLMHAAYHDALTGLPNRTQFTSDVTACLKENREHRAAVLFIDLDDFKTINDGLGHAAGDRVLRTVAGRLAEAIGPGDVAARLGGDEFALLIRHGEDVEAIEGLANRILDTIREPVDVDGRQITTSASMGIVVATWEMSAEAVQRNADVAMYRAKAAGKGRFERFEDYMQTHALERLELKADLCRAIDNEELELDYQPLVELADLSTTGVEALVRWHHPARGRVRPDEFIPLAEEAGLIHELGLWVLDEACRQLADWRREPATAGLKVAVNLSAKQLPEPNLPEQIAHVIAKHEIPADRITIEITENVLMDESDVTARRLRELRDIGVSLAIDDFGTGYSSLGYLQRYPFDVLKIDRTFVSGLDQPGPNAEVAAAIIDLANRLDVRTVAEGIETAAELAKLTALGCASGQGYFLSRPVTPQEIEDRMGDEYQPDGAEAHRLETVSVAAVTGEPG
jgi:diguanylate cyclase (GGDEF)-like protein/PAS domain S-box-containing protein